MDKAGSYGEVVAEGYLRGKGYEIIAKNYKKGHHEIDVIAQDGEYLVFIEVKYRRQTKYGRPIEAITKRKQGNLIACAYGYLADAGLGDVACRFDVVEVFGREHLEVNHVVNAFGL